MLLRGRELRYAVTLLLFEAERTLTLDELAAHLRARGFVTWPEPRKAISDALRWEGHKGRVVRMSRGRYRSRGLARSTVWP